MTDHKQAALTDIEHAFETANAEELLPSLQVAAAQVHATLYLAEQQRIGNLIALLEANHPIGDNGYDGLARFTVDKETGQQKSLLHPEIRSTLGLDE